MCCFSDADLDDDTYLIHRRNNISTYTIVYIPGESVDGFALSCSLLSND